MCHFVLEIRSWSWYLVALSGTALQTELTLEEMTERVAGEGNQMVSSYSEKITPINLQLVKVDGMVSLLQYE